jgi:FkbM family methyltransferase
VSTTHAAERDRRVFNLLAGFPTFRGRNRAAEAYGRIRRPAEVELDGVTVQLDDAWATAELRLQLYGRSFESVERQILEDTLLSSDRYLELGAGTGYMATAACRIVGSDNVVAYEANPQMVQVAERTFALNDVSPKLIHAVLGDREGSADFYLHEHFTESTLKPTEGLTRISVPRRSFAQALDAHRPTYLMVDIEGAEVELLARKLPADVTALCVETHPQVVGREALDELAMSLTADRFLLDSARSTGTVWFLTRAGRPQ